MNDKDNLWWALVWLAFLLMVVATAVVMVVRTGGETTTEAGVVYDLSPPPTTTYVSPRVAEVASRHARRQEALVSAERLVNVGDPWRDEESLSARGRVAEAMRAARAAEEARAAREAAVHTQVGTSNPAPSAPSHSGWPAVAACIRQIESSGNYAAVSPSGKYRGAYQFDLTTWASVGGSGDPAAASPAEQDARAHALWQARGLQPWPTPARRC